MAQFPLDNLISEIVDETNLITAYDYVIDHLDCTAQRRKYRPDKDAPITPKDECRWQEYYKRRTAVLEELKRQLESGTFTVTRNDVQDIHVKDGPKERDCQAPTINKRIGIHAIMVVVERYLLEVLINNTASSIKGRGMHWLHHIVEDDIHADPDNMRYYYQCDISKFYDSIDQELLKSDIRRYISDPVLLPILDRFIILMENGISKGLRSSQCFANLHLSDIDHIMTGKVRSHKIKSEDGKIIERPHYYRYCDDIVMFAPNKKELWRLRDILVNEVDKLGLKIKHNEAVRPLSEMLNYLGYVTDAEHSLIRKRTKQKVARKLAKIKSRKRRQEVIGSFKGMACHADCKHLFFTLTHHHMKKFSEMGVVYTPADGKKRFPGKVTRLLALHTKKIEVYDYEKDLSTSQGDGRYLVSFKNPETGEWGKFFTKSDEMKNVLDQIANMKDGFPFETVIESEIFDGNKIKYRFT